MTRIARQLVEGLAQAYKQAHSEEPDLQQPPPSAEQVEASGIAALHQTLYGTPTAPTAPKEEPS
jgi:hypothetical protein